MFLGRSESVEKEGAFVDALVLKGADRTWAGDRHLDFMPLGRATTEVLMPIKVEVYVWEDGMPKPAPSELFDEIEVPDSGWLPQIGDTIHLVDRKGVGQDVVALTIVHRDLLFGWSGQPVGTPIPLTQWAIYGRSTA